MGDYYMAEIYLGVIVLRHLGWLHPVPIIGQRKTRMCCIDLKVVILMNVKVLNPLGT